MVGCGHEGEPDVCRAVVGVAVGLVAGLEVDVTVRELDGFVCVDEEARGGTRRKRDGKKDLLSAKSFVDVDISVIDFLDCVCRGVRRASQRSLEPLISDHVCW